YKFLTLSPSVPRLHLVHCVQLTVQKDIFRLLVRLLHILALPMRSGLREILHVFLWIVVSLRVLTRRRQLALPPLTPLRAQLFAIQDMKNLYFLILRISAVALASG